MREIVMPLSDLDEFTGRSIDGVSRGARLLSTFDAIKDAIGSGDRDRERAGFEHARLIWSEMTEKERRGVAHLMSAKFVELRDALAGGARYRFVDAEHLRDLRSALEHFRSPPAGEQRVPSETQATISAWAEATFGPSGSNARAIARANREMAELLEHVTADDRHPEAAEEIADIVIVLSRVMTRLGVDLQAEIDQKMAKNRARKWRLDGTGHGYHVEEAAVRPRNSCCGNTGTHGEGGREYCSTCGQEILP
jgi:hypothetical protein